MRLPTLLCFAAALSSTACVSSLFAPPADAPHRTSASPRFGPASITFKNDMGNAFRLQSVQISLDGAQILARSRPDKPEEVFLETPTFPVFSGVLREGDHLLQVLLLYRGHGSGIFSYLRGYKFEVRSSHSFKFDPAKPLDLLVVAYEKGGVTTPLEERPAVRFVSQPKLAVAAPAEPPAEP